MSTVQRVAKNTTVVVVGRGITLSVGLIITIYLARYLGVVGFGKYSFVFAYLAFFGIVTDLGLQQILVREMARDWSSASELIGNAYIIRLVLSLFAIALSIVIITLMSYPADTTTYIYIAAFTLLFISFSDFYASIFQANLAMEYSVIPKIIFKFLSGGLIFYLIFTGGTLTEIILIIVFSEMIKMLLCYYFSKKFLKPDFTINFGLWKYLLKESLPLGLTSIMWIIYYKIDMVMLSMICGDAAVGFYSAAYGLSEPFSIIPTALVISLLPIMSVSFKESSERLVKSYELGIKYLIIVLLPIAVGMTFIADRFILLVYGAEFAASTVAFQILIWSLIFISINYLLATVLIAMNRQVLNTWALGLGTVVNIILNLILIPIMGFKGAALVTVVAAMVITLVCFYFVSKYLLVIPVWKLVISPLGACVVMGCFLFYFHDINLFLLVFLAAIVYFLGLLLLRGFTEEDLYIAKKVMRKR